MQMVYNSDNYAVVQFDGEALLAALPAASTTSTAAAPGPATVADPAATAVAQVQARAPQAARAEPGPGGFEIVDKMGRADIYLRGAVAERFQRGAQALMQQFQGEPDVDALDAYIAGFAALGRQPLTMH